MSDDQGRPQTPVLRRGNLELSLANSRLVTRGLSVLQDIQRVCLEIVEVIGFESSIFILSVDWDRDVHVLYRHAGQERDRTWANRSVVLYEFGIDGEYIRKLSLPLVRLTPEGYSRITDRRAGSVIVRSTFLHFYEEFKTSEYRGTVRVDYLFSRSGERLAAWCNEPFADRYRTPEERYMPADSGMGPDFFTDRHMIRLDSELHYYPPTENVFGYSKVMFAYATRPEPFIQQVKNPEVFHRYGRTISSLANRPILDRWKLTFPADAVFIGNAMHSHGWNSAVANADSIWFMAWEADNEQWMIWRLEFADDSPRVTALRFPSPLDLFRDGVINILDEALEDWVLNEERLRALSEAEMSLLGSSANTVIVKIRVEASDMSFGEEPILVQGEVGESGISSLRQIDPFEMQLQRIDDSRASLSGQEWDNLVIGVVEGPHPTEYCFFTDGCLVTNDDRGDVGNTVFVFELQSATMRCFLARVPERDITPEALARLRVMGS